MVRCQRTKAGMAGSELLDPVHLIISSTVDFKKIYFCLYRHIWYVLCVCMCMSVRGQPWVSVLVFRFVLRQGLSCCSPLCGVLQASWRVSILRMILASPRTLPQERRDRLTPPHPSGTPGQTHATTSALGSRHQNAGSQVCRRSVFLAKLSS